MGLNFYAVCHRHRETMFISRGDEHQGLHSFYRAHCRCVLADKDAVQVQGDGYSEQDWMDESSGYAQFYFSCSEPPEFAAERTEKWGMGYRVREPGTAHA